MENSAAPAPRGGSNAPPPTLAALFLAFLQVGVFGFGGALVWVHRIVVERREWVSAQDFSDLLTLAQFMPGPNIASVAVCVGVRLRGIAGAVAALTGFIAIPGVAGFVIGLVLLDFVGSPVMQNVLSGIAATAAGLLIGTGIRLLRAHPGRGDAWIMASAAFVLMAIVRLPLVTVLLALAPVGIALAAWRATRVS